MQWYKGLKGNNGTGRVKFVWGIGRMGYCWEYMDG